MNKSRKFVPYSIFIFATLIFFAGFFTNFWEVVDEEWFINQNYPMESHVIGRMVESRQSGIFSYGGLPGIGNTSQEPYESTITQMQKADIQFQAYREELNFETYTPYKSQIGGQGMLFSLLDKLILLSPHYKLIIFRALTSSLTAIFLSMVIFWFYGEFGLITSIIVLISIALSSWLVVFGGKLWWSLWSFFLPMVAVMYFLRNKNLKNLNITIFGLTIFGVVFIKCFISGYEYISTALIMMMVPFIYYCILEKLELKPFIKLSSVAVVSSIFALLLSFAVLSIQIASVDGSIQSGVQHIIYSLGKRTYGDPNLFPSIYQASLQAKTMDVLFTYIKGNYFASNHGFTSVYGLIVNKLPTIGYSHLIITFGIASVLLWALRTKTNTTDLKSRKRSLVITTWFSLLAPLSWFIIFKAHSYIHEGMNFIVWQMPYTLFGFAECGLVIQTIIEEVHKNRKSTPDKI